MKIVSGVNEEMRAAMTVTATPDEALMLAEHLVRAARQSEGARGAVSVCGFPDDNVPYQRIDFKVERAAREEAT